MVGVEILPVRSKRERFLFITMPWKLYLNEPHWVPPTIFEQKKFIDPKRGVFFDHGEGILFLARKHNKIVGRISAHINYIHDQIYHDDKGFFGFFECENNQQTANALFQAAIDYLKQKGKKYIEGPFSFGIYDEIGVLVDGFNTDPYILNIHNPLYYRDLLERAGFEKSVDWYAYRCTSDIQLDEKLFLARDRVLKRPGFHLRNINLRELKKEVEIIIEIFHSAWKNNWGHVPFTDRELERLLHGLARFAIPELSFIIELNATPVAFALCLYDANVLLKQLNGRLFPFGFIRLLVPNRRKINRFRLILMGVMEKYRNRGLEIPFYTCIAEKAPKIGFREMEISLVVENNIPLLSTLQHLPVELYKTYRIYKKHLAL